MRLIAFTNLIKEMPVDTQSFEANESTKIWRDVFEWKGSAGQAIRDLYGRYPDRTLSRRDLFDLAEHGPLDQFVIATLVWGYPTGGRGNNIRKLLRKFETLVSLIKGVKDGEAPESWDEFRPWLDEFKKKHKLSGLGVSTYTKYLYFLRTKVDGRSALILDAQVARVLNGGKYEELSELVDVKEQPLSMERNYSRYLEHMWSSAEPLHCHADRLEIFLFTFGSTLKEQ